MELGVVIGTLGLHRDHQPRLEMAKLCPQPCFSDGHWLLEEGGKEDRGVQAAWGLVYLQLGKQPGCSQPPPSAGSPLEAWRQRRRHLGTPGETSVPQHWCFLLLFPSTAWLVGTQQIVLYSQQAERGLAGGQGFFLPFPIIVNGNGSTKA